jgi:integrase
VGTHALCPVADEPAVQIVVYHGARQYCSDCKAIVARYDITYAHAKKLWKNRDKERPTIIWPSDEDPTAVIIPKINIHKSLRKAAAELGIEEFHPHQMRHTWATRLLEEGLVG